MKYQRNITGVDEFFKDYENVILPDYGVPQDDLIEQVGEMAVENQGSSFSIRLEQERTKDGDARLFQFQAESDESNVNASILYLGVIEG